jgi:hypothetical protein
MAVLWPRASSRKSRPFKKHQFLRCRVSIGWEDTRLGAARSVMNSGKLVAVFFSGFIRRAAVGWVDRPSTDSGHCKRLAFWSRIIQRERT